MKNRRILAVALCAILVVSAVSIIATGMPSTNNPRRQDSAWEEQGVLYNMTYLANGNVTVTIEPPDVFEFEGNGTVVMWMSKTVDGKITAEHIVMKIENGEITWQKSNDINIRAMYKHANKNGRMNSEIDLN